MKFSMMLYLVQISWKSHASQEFEKGFRASFTQPLKTNKTLSNE